jgi:hypothetical protein
MRLPNITDTKFSVICLGSQSQAPAAAGSAIATEYLRPFSQPAGTLLYIWILYATVIALKCLDHCWGYVVEMSYVVSKIPNICVRLRIIPM